MDFLWSGSKTDTPNADVALQTKEFDDLLASKDAELQAILGGLDIPEPSAPSVPLLSKGTDVTMSSSSSTSTVGTTKKSSTSGNTTVSSRPTHTQTLPRTNEIKSTSEVNTVLGVPRKYVLFVFMTLFMGLSIFKLMGSMWADSDLDETFSSESGAGAE